MPGLPCSQAPLDSAEGGRSRRWRMRTEAGEVTVRIQARWGQNQSVGCGDTEWLDSDNNLNIFLLWQMHIT